MLQNITRKIEALISFRIEGNLWEKRRLLPFLHPRFDFSETNEYGRMVCDVWMGRQFSKWWCWYGSEIGLLKRGCHCPLSDCSKHISENRYKFPSKQWRRDMMRRRHWSATFSFDSFFYSTPKMPYHHDCDVLYFVAERMKLIRHPHTNDGPSFHKKLLLNVVLFILRSDKFSLATLFASTIPIVRILCS